MQSAGKDIAIRVAGLAHDHAGERALRGIDLSVASGSLTGIIGADGAGKSTLFRILATLLKPSAGQAHILGLDLRTQAQAIRSKLGYMPQRFSLYPDLSVLENLRFYAEIVAVPRKQVPALMEELLEFSRLGPVMHRQAGKLSGGMKQKLALSCAMVRKPPILLLDEPTVGVDPVTRRDFWDMLKTLRNQGTTALVSTPYMDEAELCDQVMLLHHGHVVGSGTPQALCASLPGTLWKLTGPGSQHVDVDCLVPEPLTSLYVSGGELRALCPSEVNAESVLAAARQLSPELTHCEPTTPHVEDVLLHALGKAQATEEAA